MLNKKRIIIYFILILILILIVSKLIVMRKVKYNISFNDMNFNIQEIHNKNNIYFEIKNDKLIYPININIKTSDKKLINNIYTYSDDDYKCILPVIKNKIYTDFLCYSNDDILYNYQTIKGKNNDLDNYVDSVKNYELNQKNYDFNLYNNTLKYYNNTEKIVSITTYNGVFVNGENIKIFENDIYNNKLNTYLNNYYITADYNSKYEFTTFYVINLIDASIFKINSKESISFDSYIQGIVEDKIYLYDIDNKTQYEIDIYNKQINIVSDKNNVKYYKNNKWEKLSINKADKEIVFDYMGLDKKYPNYDYEYSTENYYYLINKNDNFYDLYRVNKNNLSIIQYLTQIQTKDIQIFNDYIYYLYKDTLYYYSDCTGLIKMLSDTEFNFNHKIKYYIY